MLAQNFKTAADLGLSDAEFDALAQVLGMLEREEIEPRKFSMRSTVHDCGSPACICGWAGHVSNWAAFPEAEKRFSGEALLRRLPKQLNDLFLFSRGGLHTPQARATPSQAAIALRNYLTHGEPRWAEALAS